MNKNLISHLELETEIGVLKIEDYLKYLSKDGAWEGELEKYAVEEIYNINIVDYIRNIIIMIYIINFFLIIIMIKIIDKHLYILININNNLYKLRSQDFRKGNSFKRNEQN